MNDNTPEKTDLTDREFGSVSGGAPENYIKCQYCGKYSTASGVDSKSKSSGCWSTDTVWLCRHCGNWNDKWYS